MLKKYPMSCVMLAGRRPIQARSGRSSKKKLTSKKLTGKAKSAKFTSVVVLSSQLPIHVGELVFRGTLVLFLKSCIHTTKYYYIGYTMTRLFIQ